MWLLGQFSTFYFFLQKDLNCFCGMVDRRKAFSLISSRDHCQRSSPSRISDTPREILTITNLRHFTHIKSTKSTKHEQTPFAQIFFILIKSTKRKQATFTQMFFYTHKKHKKYKT